MHLPFLGSLYLQRQGSVLSKERERFVVGIRGEMRPEIPALKEEHIVVFDNDQLSTLAINFC
jgi:CRISPR/Cas system-associated endonuclease Cas1